METESVSDEQLITELLSGIAWIGRAVTHKVIDLRRDDRLSGLTWNVHVAKTFEVDYPSEIPPGMYTDVRVDAYVDGSIEGAHGIAWTLGLRRRKHGWELDRGLTLHANDERDDVVEELPDVEFRDSAELVAALPALVDEWLDMPIPPIPAPSED